MNDNLTIAQKAEMEYPTSPYNENHKLRQAYIKGAEAQRLMGSNNPQMSVELFKTIQKKVRDRFTEKALKFLIENKDNANYVDLEGVLYTKEFIEDFLKVFDLPE